MLEKPKYDNKLILTIHKLFRKQQSLSSGPLGWKDTLIHLNTRHNHSYQKCVYILRHPVLYVTIQRYS